MTIAQYLYNFKFQIASPDNDEAVEALHLELHSHCWNSLRAPRRAHPEARAFPTKTSASFLGDLDF